MDDIKLIFEGLISIFEDPRGLVMWFVAGFLLYFGIAKKKEPLLLVPISFGILLANLPLGEVIKPAGKEGDPMGFLLFFQENGLHTDLLPLLVFLGLGALTDFSPVISNPKTLNFFTDKSVTNGNPTYPNPTTATDGFFNKIFIIKL